MWTLHACSWQVLLFLTTASLGAPAHAQQAADHVAEAAPVLIFIAGTISDFARLRTALSERFATRGAMAYYHHLPALDDAAARDAVADAPSVHLGRIWIDLAGRAKVTISLSDRFGKQVHLRTLAKPNGFDIVVVEQIASITDAALGAFLRGEDLNRTLGPPHADVATDPATVKTSPLVEEDAHEPEQKEATVDHRKPAGDLSTTPTEKEITSSTWLPAASLAFDVGAGLAWPLSNNAPAAVLGLGLSAAHQSGWFAWLDNHWRWPKHVGDNQLVSVEAWSLSSSILVGRYHPLSGRVRAMAAVGAGITMAHAASTISPHISDPQRSMLQVTSPSLVFAAHGAVAGRLDLQLRPRLRLFIAGTSQILTRRPRYIIDYGQQQTPLATAAALVPTFIAGASFSWH